MTQQEIEDFLVIDLDAERKQRAAAREGHGDGLPVRIGGQVIATLPTELPIDVLEPLRSLDSDLTLILRSAMQAVRGSDRNAQVEAGELVIDVLAANPNLPVQVLDTVTEVAKNLLTGDGFAALMAARPSPEDFAALAKGVFKFYGVSLGESSVPNDSSPDSGETSSTTSVPTSALTPVTSTPPETPSTPTGDPVSSESAAS